MPAYAPRPPLLAPTRQRGLLDLFFGGPPKAQGFGQRMRGLLDPEIAMPVAAALLSGQGNQQNFGAAFAQLGQGIGARRDRNQTMEFLRQNSPELAEAIDAGMPTSEAWELYTHERTAQKPKRNLHSAGDGRFYDADNDSWIEAPSNPNGSPETGLVPQLMQDADGNMIYVQPTKDGRLVPSQTPDGYRPVSPYDRSLQTSAGKNDADMVATMGTDIETAEKTVKEIDQLISNPGLNAVVGPLDQYRPSWSMGDQGRDALARFNQLKGRAFLQAFATLKGGGQITEVEGQKAQDAMARMDRAQGEEDFKIALQDFRDAVDAGMRKLRAVGQRIPDPRAGSAMRGGSAPALPGGGNTTSDGIQWRVK